MLGQVRLSAEGRGRIAAGRLYGLPVLRAETDLEGMFGSLRLKRAGRGLRRGGVLRVLTPAQFDRWPLLRELGLGPVSPEPLVRSLSAPLALESLRRKGVLPANSAVALRGLRADWDMRRAAEELCPQVRRLVVDAPSGGEELARWLRWEFGIPILPAGERGQVTLCFHPEVDTGEEDALELYGPSPRLAGLTVTAPALEGADRDDLPLLTALWEGGRLGRGDIKFT